MREFQGLGASTHEGARVAKPAARGGHHWGIASRVQLILMSHYAKCLLGRGGAGSGAALQQHAAFDVVRVRELVEDGESFHVVGIAELAEVVPQGVRVA